MVVKPALYQLCQAQMNLLIQSFGITTGVVYVTETGDAHPSPQLIPKLIPIVVYPERGRGGDQAALSAGSPEGFSSDNPESVAIANPPGASLGTDLLPRDQDIIDGILEEEGESPGLMPLAGMPANQGAGSSGTNDADRLLQPLAVEGVMLGFLFLERVNQPWTLREQRQVAEVIKTLEAGFTLAKRQEWLETSFAEQEHFYEMQRDRLHDLLHQFKNPLTAIRTFGKLLLRRFQGDERTTTVASHMLRESDRLQGMLRNFGDVVDLEPIDIDVDEVDVDINDPTTPQKTVAPLALPPGHGDGTREKVQPLALLPTGETNTPFELHGLLADLFETAQLLAQENNITLTVPELAPLPAVVGDRTLLQETIGNVVDNALKYTPAGGAVTIQTWVGLPYGDAVPGPVEDALLQRSPNSKTPQPQPHVVLSIQDSGLGIPDTDLQQLFQRRFRGNKTDSDIPGTGLGLAIVRDTLEALGGAIEVFSPAIALVPLDSDPLPGKQPYPHLGPVASPQNIQGTSVILWLPLKNPKTFDTYPAT